MTVPVIETERLRLRAYTPDDLDAYVAMWQEPAVIRHTTGVSFSRYESWRRMLLFTGGWLLMGYGTWAVEEKATGEFVGETGFFEMRREVTPSIEGTPEAGWVFATRTHGKGYATEAVGAAPGWADDNLPIPRTACLIAPENAGSVNVARKCGYGEPEIGTFMGGDVLIMRREAPARA